MDGEGLGEPSQRLAPAARALWRTTGLAWSAGLAIAVAMVTSWNDLPDVVVPLAWAGVAVAAILLIVVVPELRWRRWRYEIRPEEIDIRRGVWAIRRTLVPMTRVQHVDTESGPMQQGFDLATVSFHTAAGAIEIPQLTVGDAAAVRDRIAGLARTAADDV